MWSELVYAPGVSSPYSRGDLLQGVNVSDNYRKKMRRELVSCRKHTAAINFYLEAHEQTAEQQHPDIAKQIHVIREMLALLDTTIEQLWQSI